MPSIAPSKRKIASSSLDLTKFDSSKTDADKGIEMIVKIDWNFSFKQRVDHSDAYFDVKEEERELERIRARKDINNILETLENGMSEKDIVYRNLTMLSLVLASESCCHSRVTWEEI